MAENLQQQLYQNLRQALLSGRFQPGERLKIRDLADEWGTSPMPVRAALQRLVAEGALEGEPQRSLRVPLMTRERFLQILQIRQSLEGLAVEDGVPRLQGADIEVLQACTEAMEEAVRRRDVQAYLEHNSRFHLTLYRACGNPTLLRMIEALWLQLGSWNEDAAAIAENAGLSVVMDRCIKIEHARFHGGLRLGGFDTGVISSKRQLLAR